MATLQLNHGGRRLGTEKLKLEDDLMRREFGIWFR
jgi:hypothetical protein